PIGVPTAIASAVSIRLPTMGFSKPPAAPGGGVISVNTRSDRPLNPSHSNVPRIQASALNPTNVAPNDSVRTIALARRRALYILSMALPDFPLDAQQHVARNGEHDEGDEEQNEPERDQRRGVEIA